MGTNLQSYLFQAHISLKLCRVEQNCTIQLYKMAKTIQCINKCQPKTKKKVGRISF